MGGVDYIILAVILMIIGGAGYYIHRSKKSGERCIGCPNSKSCPGSCNCNKK